MRCPGLVTACLFSAISITQAAAADPTKATLVLDGLSFLSFGDEQIYSIPAGTVLVFRFDEPHGASTSFEIHPDDFNWPSLPLRGSAKEALRFGLAAPAKGTLTFAEDGTGTLSFDARIRVQVERDSDSQMKEISIRFTTGEKTATSLDGAKSIAVEGMRVGRSSRAVQLVGTHTNQADGYPEPGSAVYAVLSGAFDVLPVSKEDSR